MLLDYVKFKLANARLFSPLKVAVSACAVAGLMTSPALLADHHGSHNHQDTHGHHSASDHSQGDNPAIAAYQAANDRMHEDMAMSFTGNPDVDFAKGMIPHHEGAIAMAEIVLEYGEDLEIRQLAEDIIAAQESEIAFLREWLEQHDH
ncbi:MULTISPECIES: DUF305 domain-containing protein [Halomonadaceae]|nr:MULTISPECIES: DUF305 domain-containing protein [Halomonas]EGP21393.1 hypothetical protein GME_01484 [Halomonas sp. TD01]CAH1043728.1 hypothetical protein HPTD01_2206 [Halomonas sp. TD01]